jgi:leader peptidase (prepilin peptidase)/N-methyltransferase
MLLISQLLLAIASPFVGSFLGAVIVRWSSGRPLYSGRAVCDCGQAVLSARDMIPIASWAISQGRCRLCARGLGRLYPAIELASLLIAVWAIAVLPGNLIWTGAAFGWALLVIGMIAWREGTLPTLVVVGLAIAGLMLAPSDGWNALGDHLLGAAIAYAAYFAAAHALNRWQRRRMLNHADAILPAALGAWLGWQPLPGLLLFAAVAAALLAFAYRPPAARAVAAGLCAGAWLAWLYVS